MSGEVDLGRRFLGAAAMMIAAPTLTPPASAIRVLWNSIESRIEMHLESTQEQDVSIEHADLDLHFMPGETIHTENSYKFTDQGIRRLLKEVGFEIRGAWKDSRGWYTRTLACLR